MISDEEFREIKTASRAYVGNIAVLRVYWSLCIGRKLTAEEVREVLKRLENE